MHLLTRLYGIYSVCREGDVRLVNPGYSPMYVYGINKFGGVVQVCVNQQYGYICADNWDDREADVVCRSLSYYYKAPYYGLHIFNTIQL